MLISIKTNTQPEKIHYHQHPALSFPSPLNYEPLKPHNSNQDYAAPVGSAAAGAAFKDTWTLSDLDVARMGRRADEQPAVADLLHTAKLTHGRGMQSYLTMMAVRLKEMRRVLKPSGSIYLHCDDAAGHYLKLLMDAVFGASSFRNHLVWRRATAHNDRYNYGRIVEHILYYEKIAKLLTGNIRWANPSLSRRKAEWHKSGQLTH